MSFDPKHFLGDAVYIDKATGKTVDPRNIGSYENRLLGELHAEEKARRRAARATPRLVHSKPVPRWRQRLNTLLRRGRGYKRVKIGR